MEETINLQEEYEKFAAEGFLTYDVVGDEELGKHFRYINVNEKEGILFITETVFEGFIYDDVIECNPQVYVCNGINSEECVIEFKKQLADYLESLWYESEDGENFKRPSEDNDE